MFLENLGLGDWDALRSGVDDLGLAFHLDRFCLDDRLPTRTHLGRGGSHHGNCLGTQPAGIEIFEELANIVDLAIFALADATQLALYGSGNDFLRFPDPLRNQMRRAQHQGQAGAQYAIQHMRPARYREVYYEATWIELEYVDDEV